MAVGGKVVAVEGSKGLESVFKKEEQRGISPQPWAALKFTSIIFDYHHLFFFLYPIGLK